VLILNIGSNIKPLVRCKL
ncbi:hypothetical protein VCCP1035_0892B, partial [Vibrio cholerae CP1035(8)]